MSTLHLDKLLNPASLVVIGASAREGSPRHKVTRNLLQGGYLGKLYLVNPRCKSVLDTPCHRSLKLLPETPELAVILTPARLLRKVLVQCSHRGIRVAIIMFGTEDPKALHRYAQRLGMRLLGPYCAGLMRPHIGLNASYSDNRIDKGNLAIVSQSASLAAAMLDWAQTSNVGFSALLSTGTDTDISLSDLLDLLAEDWQTKAVIVYVERISNSRSFLSALSATARIKPVVLMRSAHEGARYCDALTRTGEVYSSDAVFQSALHRAGVVRIRTFQNLLAAAKILSTRIRVKGNRLAIVSNGSAPAMMALERMEIKQFEVPSLATETLCKLTTKLNGQYSGRNPIVLRQPEQLAQSFISTVESLQQLGSIDAILVIFIPDSRNDPGLIAESLTQCLPTNKPLLACWMGDASVNDSHDLLSSKGIPSFQTPESAIDGFDFLHRYFVSQQQLLQLPNPTSRSTQADVNAAREIVKAEVQAGQRVLGPMKTRLLLKLFDIPTLQTARATSLQDALHMAKFIGYPLAMKLVSPNISYKASVIETQLNIDCAEAVEQAWCNIEQRLHERRPEAQFRGVLLEAMHTPANSRQLAVAISRDPLFGPVLSISVGGDLTALVNQRAVQLPPLNGYLIAELLQTREIHTYMGAFRHSSSVNNEPVTQVLRRLSELACEVPDIFSLDINPLTISEDGAVAMDVQIVLEASSVKKRYAHLAIHPYPWQWIRDVTLKNNTAVQLRPIRPEDADSIIALVKEMSAESRYFRFMHAINELSPQMVAQFTKLDYDRQMAFVATSLQNAIVGVSRYTMSNDRLSGEFAISVSEQWKGMGLATALMQLLIEHATVQGLEKLQGDVLRTNAAMQALMHAMGFIATTNYDDPDVILYTYSLNKSA